MKPEPDAGHVLSFPRRGGQDLARLLWEDRGPDHIRVMTPENDLGRAEPNAKHIAQGVVELLESPHVLWPARPLVALRLLAEVERRPIPLREFGTRKQMHYGTHHENGRRLDSHERDLS